MQNLHGQNFSSGPGKNYRKGQLSEKHTCHENPAGNDPGDQQWDNDAAHGIEGTGSTNPGRFLQVAMDLDKSTGDRSDPVGQISGNIADQQGRERPIEWRSHEKPHEPDTDDDAGEGK